MMMMNNINNDSKKKTDNYLIFPLKLLEPGVTPELILAAGAYNYGKGMEFCDACRLAEDIMEFNFCKTNWEKLTKREFDEDCNIHTLAGGLAGFGISFYNDNEVIDLIEKYMPEVHGRSKGGATVRVRLDYFMSWWVGGISTRTFTTVCAILSKIGSKSYVSMNWQEIAARQVGSMKNLKDIDHPTMTRQNVRTELANIIERRMLSRVVYHNRHSYYSVRHNTEELKEEITAFQQMKHERRGKKFDLSADHFNEKQPLTNHLVTTYSPHANHPITAYSPL